MGKRNNPPLPAGRQVPLPGQSVPRWKMDENKTRNTILDTLCLLIAGEIISILAGKNFSWAVTVVTAIEVALFIILAFLAKRNPYPSILSALVLFIIISIITAALKPTYLGGSIIIKIFILIYLVRAISDARELQAFKKGKLQK
ncbi:hypothetical protein [Agriterribacter sp.]|uniref:hypothetical protein n=1 Tax=Agriterribacter sp. TaxID=2821509 RepID=UPI002BF6D4D4|nr:hypothetical protein [Agriterribacter sp.]HRO44892.1 hypothetical protein [Agriterribacter sp.]HRQ15630.1 hypothetical protein [Agriterribacter sp.]